MVPNPLLQKQLVVETMPNLALAKSILVPSFGSPEGKQRIGPNNILATSAMKDQLTQDLKGKPVSPWVKVIAGMAGGVAEAVCLQPLDVAKTRLQLDSTGKYGGLLNCGRTIVKEEGYTSLYKGTHGDYGDYGDYGDLSFGF